MAASMDTAIDADSDEETTTTTTTTTTTSPHHHQAAERIHRLERIRNVGILAHVDAGKTTVTERLLALGGQTRRVGRVDAGTTVTDYLPQERERGITIQSAAIHLAWGWHNRPNNNNNDNNKINDRVNIHILDTPGHVDFSVEVHRSVAVLDGAVLVVDAQAGVQAQTETVWRSCHTLPTLICINKMDKEGSAFAHAVQSIRHKLPGANPIPLQLPLIQVEERGSRNGTTNCLGSSNLVAVPAFDHTSTKNNQDAYHGTFVGVLDLIAMRAIVYPQHMSANSSTNVEDCVPQVVPLLLPGHDFAGVHDDCLVDPACPLTRAAIVARHGLVEHLAVECGSEPMEGHYLHDTAPSPHELRQALRHACLQRHVLPVVAAAALHGKGMEPLLDAMADYLPSPLDVPPPALMEWGNNNNNNNHKGKQNRPHKANKEPSSQDVNAPTPLAPSTSNNSNDPTTTTTTTTLGHPLHDDLLAFCFKVLHMPNKGGSGDGRVVFCRVYSGEIKDRDVLQVVGEGHSEVRVERVAGMLELQGGSFHHLTGDNSVCQAGNVCALVGLKHVVTGDTLVLAPAKGGGKVNRKQQQKQQASNHHKRVCLAGVASPQPVLKVRLETETQSDHTKLSDALRLLVIEDPSLHVEENEAGTLLSGLGELHIEVTLDRLQREFGLTVHQGSPSVAYRETIHDPIDGGWLEYDRTVGGTRMQAAVHLMLEPTKFTGTGDQEEDPLLDGGENSACRLPMEPTVVVSDQVKHFLQVDLKWSEETCFKKSPVYRNLVQGCLGALRRGPAGNYAMANVTCHVVDVDAEDGVAGLQNLPGSIRAAAMHAVSSALSDHPDCCRVLEPSMTLDISVPNDMVGSVLSDLTSRRGTVENVLTGDESESTVLRQHQKTLVRAQVPLVEILGYANSLRSLTGGEGTFTAEYKGHSICS